jgi:hypothetical protein
MKPSNVYKYPDDKPIDNFQEGDKAEPKKKSKEAAPARNEVINGHSRSFLVF